MAQSAAASFNPSHKIIDQHTEAPVHYRIKKRMEAQEDAMELYERLRLPNPTEIGFPLSAPGLGRSAPAGDDGHGHVLPS